MIAPAVWLWPDGSHDPVLWHLHELMFGMGGAAVAGYLLTALPNWTARGAVGPGMIAALALGWAMARAAMVLAGGLPAAIFALLWFSALSAVLLREVVAAKDTGPRPACTGARLARPGGHVRALARPAWQSVARSPDPASEL